ncbi:MAG: PQQ-binding-like beta-propeller repeat protein [Verrucomicrobiales bacterium]
MRLINRLAVVFVCLVLSLSAKAADQPQWGQKHTRNMVSAETNLPSTFDPTNNANIKWSAQIGTESHSTPVVANGKVYIGTNNGHPRNEKHQGDRGVLMCFEEKSGNFLWQLAVPKLDHDPYLDWPKSGISSPATVESNKVYIVSNRGEVLCLDPDGMLNGNDGPYKDETEYMSTNKTELLKVDSTDADILWLFDMVKDAGIYNHDGAHSSILVVGDYLYVNTGTGVDDTHRKIRTPNAPSLIVLNKRTGRLVARDNEKIAPDIFHCTWSSPSYGERNGRPTIFFAGGNGVVYAFDPIDKAAPDGKVLSLRKTWEFRFDPEAPTEDVHRFTTNKREGPSNIFGMPVAFEDQLYVAGGGDLWWGKNKAWLKVINPNKALGAYSEEVLWTFELSRHVMSTPAVHNNLVFIADCGGFIYCLDRDTGDLLWKHELGGEIWASPIVADNKVYLGTRRGDFAIFAAAPQKDLLSQTKLRSPVSATATFANQTMYVATMETLYAIER